MASKSFKATRSNLSTSSDAAESHKPPLPPSVTFGRRTSSGRYISYSRDDLDSELGSSDFMNYTVHIPPTPDNQPMDPSISQKVEEQYVSNSLFTGGFNSVTRAHLMDKVIESEASHPQMAGAKGSSCAIPGCDAKVMSDERGVDILPCECDFKICRDCYIDAVKSGGGICPGCKEPYKNTELDEVAVDSGRPLPLPPPGTMSKMERRLSLMKSTKSVLMRSQTGDFDHNRWLFETRGTYGYGNAIWPNDGGFGNGNDEEVGEPKELMNKPWRPLTRKLKIPAAVISPYRLAGTVYLACKLCLPVSLILAFPSMLLILIRIVILALFLEWRVRHPNNDAIWLWGMSVYDEFKVRINSLPDSIRRRSDAYHAREEIKAMKLQKQHKDDEPVESVKIAKATWMADGTHWPGTWLNSAPEHSRGDHAGIIQIFLLLLLTEQLNSTLHKLVGIGHVDSLSPSLLICARV
ncbi:hypothetical protein POTOM_044290 [Populus tomentosa]|uniref:Cellulose synthase-like protein D3 n=1 Tax=Populus tomentosa TaxID=118781 RepID=A0A8X7YN34_POPTO|nr:hypothetical protein POTOM_044290 [Populus tomentosa]